jgi:tetratricopeptide (TPR) repeat protein
MALIYNLKGDKEKAKNAFIDARKANPQDATLYTAELISYKDAKDLASYNALANEALNVIPNNKDLLYTLGINYADLEQYDKSKMHLIKLIEIDPKYKYANYSVGFAILGEEKAIIEQMNKLGTSAADNKKYDELKAKRDDLLKSTIPYFKAELNNVDEKEKVDILKQLVTIYTILVMDDEVKKTKAELEALEN